MSARRNVIEISVGRYLAYGEVGDDGETYSLESAPTQADYDAVAAALDARDARQIRSDIEASRDDDGSLSALRLT